ncbi:MAG: hypothetical protein ACKOI2_08125 [Actinomycetota bacterium]
MRSTTAVPANHWNRRREGPTFQILGDDGAAAFDRVEPRVERELPDRELPDRELPDRDDPPRAAEREFVCERLREAEDRDAARLRLEVGVPLATLRRLIADLQ